MLYSAGCQLKDTIAAIATFPSKSALGVIKISGRESLHIVSRIFSPKNKKDIKKAKTFTLHYGWIINKSPVTSYKSKVIDEVLVGIMRAPYSYTREDVVEISSHGGILVLNKILDLVLKEGARLAKPGEFSYRAFVNGRLDLIQAQAISDIVETKSEKALYSFSQQLKGEFSKKIYIIKASLKDIFTHLEASINFPEDNLNLDLNRIEKSLIKIKNQIYRFISRSQEGKVFKEGLRCVICGKANAGKSTLFNRLLKEERVIVTRIAGTTKDVVEETINIRGIPLRIYDTAGILEPKDLIDREAMKRSCKKLEEADIVIFVLDYSRALNREDYILLKSTEAKDIMFVVNKIDLKPKLDIKKLYKFKRPLVKISALKNIGLKDLEDAIFKMVYTRGIGRQINYIILAQWQTQILKEVNNNIEEALVFIKRGYPVDFLSFSLKPTLEKLAQLTGEVINQTILNEIFSNFCIGK